MVMTDHDPLCRWKPGILAFCECEVIAEVRADERAKHGAAFKEHIDKVADMVLADLRAKVEALPARWGMASERRGYERARADVLALLDGGE